MFIPAAALAMGLMLAALPAGAAKKKAPDPVPQVAPPPGASGSFKDRDDVRHEWRVNPSFTLLWEGMPYLPVGIVMKPRSLAEPDKAEAWDADRQTLAGWKQAGVQDVQVRPERAAAGIPITAWQRLIDEMEAQGFRYGVALPAAAPRMASAHYVHAGAIRLGPFTGTGEHTADVRVPGLAGGRVERAAATLIGQQSGRLIRVEWAKIEPSGDGIRATVRVEKAPAEEYVIDLMPLISSVIGLPDLWDGFGDIRDSLLPLAQIKFGKGLRFFVHPLAGTIDLDGPNGYMLPASEAYRVELEAFLSRKYRKIGTLRGQWAFRGDLPKDFQMAARLVPLTISKSRGRPVGYLLDEKDSRCYVIDPSESRFWYDHLYFREHSIREQINLLAQFLGEQLADVPVVLQRGGSMRYYHINERPAGGFAGIGLAAMPETFAREAGTAVGEARLAANRPWCVALSVEGCDTQERLTGAVEATRQAGVKGWFVTPPASAPAGISEWVSACRRSLEGLAEAADYLPRYILFPHTIRETGGFGYQQGAVGTEAQSLAPGIWWIPALANWDPIDLGSNLHGYGMRDITAYHVVIWSSGGKRRIHMLPHTYDTIEVRDLQGKVVSKRRRGKPLRIDVDEQPVLITGLSPLQATPIEVAKAELEELERLTREMGLKGKGVREFQGAISLARTLNPEADPRGVRQLIREPLLAARRLTQAPAPSVPQPPAPQPPAP